MALISISSTSLAEDTVEIRLTRQVELKRGPSEVSETLGILPTNTIATDAGGRTGEYRLISVELEDGKVLEGWVRENVIENSNKPSDSSDNSKEDAIPKRRGKIVIPPDEALLIRRNSSFIYGAHIGGNLALIQTDISTGFSRDLGFMAGGYAGVFLNHIIPLRFELNVLQSNGSVVFSSGSVPFGFNFFEIAAVVSLRLGSFEISLGPTYQFGVGLSDVPQGITLNSASDLSSTGACIGFGLRQNIGPDFFMNANVRYQTNFLHSPFAFHNIAFLLGFEFEG